MTDTARATTMAAACARSTPQARSFRPTTTTSRRWNGSISTRCSASCGTRSTSCCTRRARPARHRRCWPCAMGDETLEDLWPGSAGTRGAGQGAPAHAAAMEHGRPAPACGADRRDRRAGGRHAAGGAEAVAHRLRRPPGALPAQHRPVRRTRRARLSYPLDGREPPGARQAAPSTSSPSHCDWGISPSRRFGGCGRSTRQRPGSRSRRRRWR